MLARRHLNIQTAPSSPQKETTRLLLFSIYLPLPARSRILNKIHRLHSCQIETGSWLINQSHRYRRPQAAYREPAGSCDKTTRTAICFEHKTQYLLIHAPYTRIVVFWHISNIPPMISQSQISCDTPTFYIAAVFVKYCYTIGSSGCYPLGEKLLWNRSIGIAMAYATGVLFPVASCHAGGLQGWVDWGRFKNAYELSNQRALKISMSHKNHIFPCMGKIFCVEF